ncbi:MAG: transposase [Actinomycetia bacterium]|nr:transposase [Actinomycetes bacterium]
MSTASPIYDPIRGCNSAVANTFAERWIGTLRRELLDRTIIWNQRQLDRLVSDYIEHYNTHRPHRSLGQRPPLGQDPQLRTSPEATPLRIVRSTRCHGLINEYKNAA